MTDTTNNLQQGKKFYQSKTFWANTIATAAFAVQAYTGFVVLPEMQATALALINIALRFITKEPIVTKQ